MIAELTKIVRNGVSALGSRAARGMAGETEDAAQPINRVLARYRAERRAAIASGGGVLAQTRALRERFVMEDEGLRDWADPFNLRMLRDGRWPVDEQALGASMTLRHLVPNPDAVETWDDLRAVLDRVPPSPQLRADRLADLMDTAKWARAREARSLPADRQDWDGWVARLRAGELLNDLSDSIRFLARIHADGGQRSPYRRLQRRLLLPCDVSEVEHADPSGVLYLSFHSALLTLLHPPVARAHPRALRVAGVAMTSTAARNAMPIRMVKTLRGGGVVHTSPDGGRGQQHVAHPFAGAHLRVGPGFAWVAWRARCRVVGLVPVIDGEHGTRIMAIEMPRADADVPREAFERTLIERYGEFVLDATLRYPESVGATHALMHSADPRPDDDPAAGGPARKETTP